MVTSSMPTSDTRTYASMTSPLSRIVSMTSARPDGDGAPPGPPGCIALTIGLPSVTRSLILRSLISYTLPAPVTPANPGQTAHKDEQAFRSTPELLNEGEKIRCAGNPFRRFVRIHGAGVPHRRLAS